MARTQSKPKAKPCYIPTSSMQELAICGYCDTVHRRVRLPGRSSARCTSCDAILYRADIDFGALLAVALTAAIAFVIAVGFPLITMTAQGQYTEATLWRAIAVVYDADLPMIAITLAITLAVAPALEIGLWLWVLVPLRLGFRPPAFRGAMAALSALKPWRMVEVFLLGVVVAVVKMTNLATARPQAGLFGLIVMSLALATAAATDRGALWRRADEVAA